MRCSLSSPSTPTPELTVFLHRSLTESLEQTRGEKRKLETQVSQLQQQLQQQQPAPVAADHGEVEELQDQIADLEEELKDAKAREQKVRAQLLEVSSSLCILHSFRAANALLCSTRN